MNMVNIDRFVCPVCGYRNLARRPWKGSANSYEICPSCGIEFGYEDGTGDDWVRRQHRHLELRLAWIDRGSPWSSSDPSPPGWDPVMQLLGIGVDASSQLSLEDVPNGSQRLNDRET
jgi:RNA polymerase subunit RPABC4/transcription elongation factor Spt4